MLVPKRFILAFTIIIIFLVGFDIFASVIDQAKIPGIIKNIKLLPSYGALAFVGVAFHITKQVRERRDQGSFDWNKYRSDYIFRVFQALIYVIIIYSLIGDKPAESSDISLPIALISLFIGMYIRRVEEAFENFGDRFGDTLRGMLGASTRRAENEEKINQIEEQRKNLRELINNYDGKRDKLDQTQRQAYEEKIKGTLELIQETNTPAAERNLLDLKYDLMKAI